jgi:diaminopimelate epimerase
LGNDFLVVDDRNPMPLEWAALARRLCDRHTGVGADGILLIQSSTVADLRMRLFNADGSEAEMCGNGIRCVARLAADEGWAGSRMTWETGAGPVVTELHGDLVTVDMGSPRFHPGDVPVEASGDAVVDEQVEAAGHRLRMTCLSMGNPHCVIRVDDVDRFPVGEVGPALERHPRFPRRTNVEFVQILSRTRVRQRTWERGVGETNACGTGACATAVALRRLKLVDSSVDVELRGGRLAITWDSAGRVLMTGPAVEVFRGEMALLPEEKRAAAGTAR